LLFRKLRFTAAADSYEFDPYTIGMKSRLELLSSLMTLAVVSGHYSPAQNPQTPIRMVTFAQAKTLVIASPKQQKRLPGIQAEQYNDPESARFWFFTVMWAPPADWSGSVVVGNYAVDPRTGDVWSATMSCMEESNRHLGALQRHLRTDLGLSVAEYRHLKTTGPLCEK
jgi:hypothetical protein